jgi:hypothetical protein
MLAQNAPSGWETWDTRTAVVFITVTLVGALIALVWYLLKEQKEARQSFLAALDSIQKQFHTTEEDGNKKHRLLRSAMVRIIKGHHEHTQTLKAVHDLMQSLSSTLSHPKGKE